MPRKPKPPREQKTLDAVRGRVQADLEAKGFALPLIQILIPLIGPLILRLLDNCANKANPKILLRRALLAADPKKQAGAVHRGRLRKMVADLPVSLTEKELDDFCATLVSVGEKTKPDDYVAVADEIADWKITE